MFPILWMCKLRHREASPKQRPGPRGGMSSEGTGDGGGGTRGSPAALARPAAGMSERERQVMKKLKEVVDKQRDEIRARDRELGLKNEDVEAVSGSPAPCPRSPCPLPSFRGLWAAGSGSGGRGADPRPSVRCPPRDLATPTPRGGAEARSGFVLAPTLVVPLREQASRSGLL